MPAASFCPAPINPARASTGMRARQRGVVLFIALIVLVAMSMAGIALVRSVDTGVLIAGNLTFKQGTTMAGDSAVEAARTALNTLNTSGATNPLWSNSTGVGYYASIPSPEPDFVGNDANNATKFNWSTTGILLGTTSPGTTEARYVIHRMCTATGDPAGTSCIRGGSSTVASSQAVVALGGGAITPQSAQYYRITTRVVGPRNTRSYVEVIVN